MTRRSAASPFFQTTSGALVTSSRDAPARGPGTSALPDGRDVRPVDVVLRRARRTPWSGAPRRRRARRAARTSFDQVAARLATSPTPSMSTMPWFSSARERLGEAHVAQVEQHLGDEPRVEQVQDGVRRRRRRTGRPAPTSRPRARSNACVVVVRRQEAQEVPRAVDERVHRVRVALGRAAALGSGHVHPVGRRAQRAGALRLQVETLGGRQQHRQLGLRAPGTSPHCSQWMIGMGVPQYRWREISQSRSRKFFAGAPGARRLRAPR